MRAIGELMEDYELTLRNRTSSDGIACHRGTCTKLQASKWDLLKEFIAKESKSATAVKIMRDMDSAVIKAECMIIRSFGKLLVELITKAQGRFLDNAAMAKLDSLRTQIELYAAGDLDPSRDYRAIFSKLQLSENDIHMVCEKFNSAIKSCKRRWDDEIDYTCKLLRTCLLFSPSLEHTGVLNDEMILCGNVSYTSTLRAEWHEYCNVCPTTIPANVFWMDHSNWMELTPLAMRFLALRPSSTSCERTFSIMRDIERPRRYGMSTEYLKIEMILRYNRQFLQEFLQMELAKGLVAHRMPDDCH